MTDTQLTNDAISEQEANHIKERYLHLTGTVPASISDRIAVAQRTGRIESIRVIEELREQLIINNPLGGQVGQLVHFGQLLVLGQSGPARLHCAAALKAGATLSSLVGVAELALITGGMPAYSLGIAIIYEQMTSQSTTSPGEGDESP